MSIQQRFLAKRLNRYDDVHKSKKRKRSIQYLSSQKNSSSQWSDVAIDTWWKTSIRFLLMRTAFWSTSHKVIIAWSKMKYSIDFQFSRMNRLIASSQVIEIELNQNFDIEYSSWVMMLISSIDSNSRLNSSRYDLLLLIFI